MAQHGPMSQECPAQRHCTSLARHPGKPHDIFEGTEQIQQLVVSRAISGMRIE